MRTLTELGAPLAADLDDSCAGDLEVALLRARVRDTTVRLSLATFRARGYAEVWGMDAEARAWEANAEAVRADLADLTELLAAVSVRHGLAA